MEWRILSSERAYKKAVKRLDEIFEPSNKKERDEFDLLVMLVMKYEEQNFSIDEADPIQVIKMKMEYLALSQKDMIKYFGSKATTSKILNYKSPLTLKHVWVLSEVLNLPVELLARPYRMGNWNFMKKFEGLKLGEQRMASA